MNEVLSYSKELTQINREFDLALQAITDPNVRQALSLLRQRVELAAATRSPKEPPPRLPLTLSANGLQLASTQAVAPGHWIGAHLVLDEAFDFLAAGIVRRCEQKPITGHQISIEFVDLPVEQARRLARYVLLRSGSTQAA